MLNGLCRFLHHALHALTSLPPTVTLPPLLILAHKSDLLTLPSSTSTSTISASQARSTLAIARVRTILERELEKRRVAQRGGVAVEGLGAEGGQQDGMGEEGMGGLECRSGPGGDGTFRFTEWEAGEVAFLGTWVKVGAGGAVGQNEKGEKGDGEVGDGLDELREWLEELE
jgi:signal recognition particle receptor subunit beta